MFKVNSEDAEQLRGVFKTWETSTMEIFSENSLQILVVNYFCKKALSSIFDKIPNTPQQQFKGYLRWCQLRHRLRIFLFCRKVMFIL